MTSVSALPWPGPLAAAAWLQGHLGTPGLVILDVRPIERYRLGHVPGALHSDYAGWRATSEGAPGMLPDPGALASMIGALGIGNDALVVLVPEGQNAGDFGNAARIYWTFKVLGHDRVSILEGGHAGWTSGPAARPVQAGDAPAPAPARFSVTLRPELRATAAEVEAAVARGDTRLVDARGDAQFLGEAKSPAARAAGTLPGAVQLDAERLFAENAFRVEPGDVTEQPGGIITFCNTGHSAAVTWFALSEVSGRKDVRLYDGSMSHWTQDPARPAVPGRKG
ncbi:sulfurtransferase [Arenibaculum pallidiluteum]|uniref:sulfurtransferase n=1 Tax=Arenibaculum pallidiluteum TaxID=2812559 RepID=UPI001A97CA1C|nr:rhodanese-like domain-containing protein [Arenibaculum pallidiluteum]